LTRFSRADGPHRYVLDQTPGWAHARGLDGLVVKELAGRSRAGHARLAEVPVICAGQRLTIWLSCSAGDRTVLLNLTMNQAAPWAQLDLLWDGGCDLRLLEGGDPTSRRP
jgi:hypothetical protein